MPPEDEQRSELTAELRAKAEDLISHVELLDARPCAISARLEDGVSPGTNVSSVTMNVGCSFAAAPGVYGNRFDYEFVLRGDADDEALGTIEFSILLDYRVDEDFDPDPDAADFVSGTTGYFAAYPYARELFQSIAARMQFDPIVLGLIKRGSLRPGTISLARADSGDLEPERSEANA